MHCQRSPRLPSPSQASPGSYPCFGRRTSGQWSPAERARLIALLVASFIAVFFSVVPFVLLSIPLSESTCWRSLSLLLVASRFPAMGVTLRIVCGERRIAASEREASLVISAIFLTGDLLVVVALSVNAVGYGLLWPYLAAIVWVLAQAAVIFIRLVVLPISRAPAV